MVSFPGIFLRLSTENLWLSYTAENRDRGELGTPMLRRTLIISLVNTFTRPERKRKRCVDYKNLDLSTATSSCRTGFSPPNSLMAIDANYSSRR